MDDSKAGLRHILDIAKTSYNRGFDGFSDFLSPAEAVLIYSHIREIPQGKFYLYGGTKSCERTMACFPSRDYADETEIDFPISCVKISSVAKKFQKKELTHRDYLGYVLGLGIDRKLTGDIFVNKEESNAYLFCKEDIAGFLIDNLSEVGHNAVKCELVDSLGLDFEKNIEERTGTVQSLRLDAVISEVYNLSRTNVKEIIEKEMVSRNSILISNPHIDLSDGDIISVRGHGKFVFYGSEGETRKGRTRFKYGLYT